MWYRCWGQDKTCVIFSRCESTHCSVYAYYNVVIINVVVLNTGRYFYKMSFSLTKYNSVKK